MDELKSMRDNDIWDLVELPKGVKSVSYKWIFKTKRDSKGNIERYKARLVAKWFTQKEDIDYKETFSPVSSKDSLRIVMALVAHYDLELHQMVIKPAFLKRWCWRNHIYMVQPKCFSKERLGKEINGGHPLCIGSRESHVCFNLYASGYCVHSWNVL